MNIEIDQSGKVEHTDKDTVLAFSNGKSFAIKIKASTKRKLLALYRQAEKPKMYTISIFCIILYFLIKEDLNQISEVIIDVEYRGKEKLIFEILKDILLKKRLKVPNIYFDHIGKKSSAHILAIKTLRKTIPANHIISLEEIKNEGFLPKINYLAASYEVFKGRGSFLRFVACLRQAFISASSSQQATRYSPFL